MRWLIIAPLEKGTFLYKKNPRKASLLIWDGKIRIINKPAVPPALKHPVVSPPHSTNNDVNRMSLLTDYYSTHQLRNVLLFTASARRSQSMTSLPAVRLLHKQLFPSLLCSVLYHRVFSPVKGKFIRVCDFPPSFSLCTKTASQVLT